MARRNWDVAEVGIGATTISNGYWISRINFIEGDGDRINRQGALREREDPIMDLLFTVIIQV